VGEKKNRKAQFYPGQRGTLTRGTLTSLPLLSFTLEIQSLATFFSSTKRVVRITHTKTFSIFFFCVLYFKKNLKNHTKIKRRVMEVSSNPFFFLHKLFPGVEKKKKNSFFKE
jgi:hypothetical protein